MRPMTATLRCTSRPSTVTRASSSCSAPTARPSTHRTMSAGPRCTNPPTGAGPTAPRPYSGSARRGPTRARRRHGAARRGGQDCAGARRGAGDADALFDSDSDGEEEFASGPGQARGRAAAVARAHAALRRQAAARARRRRGGRGPPATRQCAARLDVPRVRRGAGGVGAALAHGAPDADTGRAAGPGEAASRGFLRGARAGPSSSAGSASTAWAVSWANRRCPGSTGRECAHNDIRELGADPAQGLDLAAFGKLGLPPAALEQIHAKLPADLAPEASDRRPRRSPRPRWSPLPLPLRATTAWPRRLRVRP